MRCMDTTTDPDWPTMIFEGVEVPISDEAYEAYRKKQTEPSEPAN